MLRRLVGILSLSVPATCALATVHYHLGMQPDQQNYQVQMSFETSDPVTKIFIPHWSPGFYFLQTFEKTISEVNATNSDGQAVKVSHPSPREWDVEADPKTSITFKYQVHAVDPGLGFFGAYLGHETGFINGASTFCYIDGRKTEPDTLSVTLPDQWKIETPLDKNDQNEYEAKTGYDEFIDCPIQLGSFEERSFTVNGIPYKVVFVTKDEKLACNPDFEAKQLQILSKPALDLFGASSFKHYTYFLHLKVGDFAGGLEHRSSTCIAIDNSSELHLDDLATHENFHAWNVKQIRPVVLGPFDYQNPCRTGLLWWMEGVTDYFAKLLAYRSGVTDQTWLLDAFRDQVSEYQESKTKNGLTLNECSRTCWENGGFGVGDFSYYTKGLLAGWILDAAIRTETNNSKSLDDVMRYLYSHYKLPQPGMQEDGIQKAISTIVGSDALNGLLHTLTETTDPLPYSILQRIGIQVRIAGAPFQVPGFASVNGKVTQVSPESASAGLHVGDEIVAVSNSYEGGVIHQTVSVRSDNGVVKLTLPPTMDLSQRTAVVLDPNANETALNWLKQYLNRPDSLKSETN